MKFKKVLTFLLLIAISLTLSACEITTKTQTTPIEIGGEVVLGEQSLSGVVIKSTTQNYATTSLDGLFNFSTNQKQIEIYAEKQGYTFSPKTIVITENTTDIIFTATEVEDLDGTMSLAKINITPTSLTSTNDNYVFLNNNKKCLKISSLNISLLNESYTVITSTQPYYAEKSQTNTIDFNFENITQLTSSFYISFNISAYFTHYNNEYVFTEERPSSLFVSAQKTTADLTDDNTLEYTLFGVNSSNNSFSYNITFVFKYTPAN